jgi:hypothetical protein
METVEQQLKELSALFDLALSGDQNAQQKMDVILRAQGTSFVEQVRALDGLERAIADPVNQRIKKLVESNPMWGDMPYTNVRRAEVKRCLNAPIEGNGPQTATESERKGQQPAETSADNGQQVKVWEKIPDCKWDRLAVKMLYEGHTSPEIANKIGDVIAKTVDNRLSVLRSQYDFIETRDKIERRNRQRKS